MDFFVFGREYIWRESRMTKENDRNVSFMSPSKGLRGGLKGLSHQDRSIALDEIFNDDELAQRKAEEAGKIFQNFPFFIWSLIAWITNFR